MAEHNITKDIIKTANTIRAKYNILKSSNIMQRTQLEDTFKSISKPLNELVKHAAKSTPLQLQQQQQLPQHKAYRKRFKPVKNEDTDTDASDETVKNDNNNSGDSTNDHFFSPNDTDDEYKVNNTVGKEYSKFNTINVGNIANEYIQKLENNDSNIDKRYGVRVEAGQFMIGSSKLTINENDLTLDDATKFIGTKGLYELIFLKNPRIGVYNKADLATYSEILKQSNACRRDFKPQGVLAGNRSYKYTNIIKYLTHSGDGMMMQLDNHKIEYTYWDDPNELVDRLRLLMASNHAGNNSHNNEIILIIEELREAGIIK